MKGAHSEEPSCFAGSVVGQIQDIVLFLGFCPRINTILYAPSPCLGTPPPPVIAYTIVQYNVSPRPPVIAIYTTQYWQWQYRVKDNSVAKLLALWQLCDETGAHHRVNPIYIYMDI